ncbi:MAG TPA: hypothetical protein VFG35_02385, partial [Actinoplanes sp.]|nr:hypothetical protein [Actinoplanes sp.]
DSSQLLASLLDGLSPDDPDLLSRLEERMSSLSPEAQKEIVDLRRRAIAGEDTLEGDIAAIEYVYAPQLIENNHGFLPLHIHELIAFVRERIAERENGIALEPRGSSKSTSVTQGWLTKYIAKHPDIRIGLFSNTDTQAFAFSGGIRRTLESDRAQELWGNCVSNVKWTDAEWLHRDSKWARSKDRTLFASGVGGAIVSKRFDIVLFDDILDKENTATPEQLQKVWEWFWLTVRPCLTPTGIMLYIGTRWAEDDTAEVLIKPKDEGGKGWKSLVVPALVEDPEEPLGYRSYWPDRWPVVKLLAEREEMGSAMFDVAYMNDLSGLMHGDIFHKIPEDYYFSQLPPGEYTLKMGVDLASSEKERADWTARVTTAVDAEGTFWVLSAVRDKRETHHAEFIADGFAANTNIGLVICDSQAFQSTLVQQVLQDYPGIPIEGRKNDNDKVTRARAVAAKYEGHKVRHHISLKDSPFEKELMNFPKGHDDFVDALGYSMDLTMTGFFFGSLRRGSLVRS